MAESDQNKNPHPSMSFSDGSGTDDQTLPPFARSDIEGIDGGTTKQLAEGKCPFEHQQRTYRVNDYSGFTEPLFNGLGRVLRALSSKSSVRPEDRPPCIDSTPWFGPTKTVRTHPFDFLREGTTRLGPVFSFEVFGKRFNIVSGGEAKRLARESESLGLDRKTFFTPFANATGVSIFAEEGEKHEQLRKLVRYGYARGTVSPFVSLMSQTIQEQIERWPSKLNLQSYISELSIRTLAAAISPKPLPIDWNDLGKMGELALMVTVRLRPPFILKLPKIKGAIRRAFNALDPIIQEHRDGLTRNDPRPWMIDAFMAAEADGMTLDNDGVRGGVLYALIAAYTYLNRLTLLMIAEIARDPRAQSAVKKEVDAAFAKGQLDASTLRSMPTLRALFVETMRRYPLLPGMPYETTQDIAVGDYIIGQNEVVLLTTVPNQFDETHYSCPYNFDSGRVRPPRNEHRNRDAYRPWGLAPRTCLAAGLSEITTMTLVANIMHRFDIDLHPKSDSIPVFVNPLVGPANGLSVELLTRQESDRIVDPSVLFEERTYAEETELVDELPDLTPRKVKTGETIYQEGDPATDFFILLEGHVTLSQNAPKNDQWQISSVRPGEGFGELGILKEAPRQESAEADEDSELLVVNGKDFIQFTADYDEDAISIAERIKRTFVSKSLQKCLDGVKTSDLDNVEGIELQQFDRDEVIINQGEPAKHAYLVVAGRVEVISLFENREVALAELGTGDIFGEIGVIENRNRTATVKALESTVVARLTRDSLSVLMDSSSAANSGLQVLIARRMMQIVDSVRK